MSEGEPKVTRRTMLRNAAGGALLLGVAGSAGALLARGRSQRYVWQIDPHKCIQCGNCATYCVLDESAVKCVHAYDLCGRCNMCTGYYESRPGSEPNTGAEHQLCPTDAIIRTPIDGMNYRNFEYSIDEDLCIGCGKCVAGCETQNGSLYLQVKHERCLNCNECTIAAACPGEAFFRVPAETPYYLKAEGKWGQ